MGIAWKRPKYSLLVVLLTGVLSADSWLLRYLLSNKLPVEGDSSVYGESKRLRHGRSQIGGIE